jgi:murein DD-endopeptidase MepM/ murein hydrolase activator NlpD
MTRPMEPSSSPGPAPASRRAAGPGTRRVAAIAVVAIVLGAGLLAGIALLGPGGGRTDGAAAATTTSSPAWPAGALTGLVGPSASSCATPAPLASTGICTAPTATAAGGAAATPTPAASSSAGVAAPHSTASPSGATAAASPAPTAPDGAAPTTAAGFKVRGTVVPMAFPLPATAKYAYGAGWRVPRDGPARPYEQIRGVAPDGTYLRAHGGLDLLVKLGTPVYAPFSGKVVDPAKRWKPWDPARYGKVVVIESTEPASPGYTVVLAHLSTTKVKIGDTVERGDLVGKTGKTGNAAGTPPHLHLELHAPFKIRYGYAHVIRRLDVFDAEPSVRTADPKAR